MDKPLGRCPFMLPRESPNGKHRAHSQHIGLAGWGPKAAATGPALGPTSEGHGTGHSMSSTRAVDLPSPSKSPVRRTQTQSRGTAASQPEEPEPDSLRPPN